ncbi:class I SAM-dependent methyltransferase [Prosthecobacter sp. SYSU 5D2]|uniref:class I SAM-dependent methyltransferase n=1 Tax=Prosthecobacter sp. SYSU 5D2 TaxID=3134134 RepID=UPI0031FEA442
MSTPYDQVPYPCNAYAQTHPAHLAMIARLHGLDPAAPEQCRVLEIGCGDGGNLLPLAYVLPGSRFLGIDLAATSIEAGLKHAQAFGLTNIDFQALDLMQLSREDIGEWDYIVAHGVFSWVPEPVRLRLLALCREVLAPQGVAFISYNAHPGSHLRGMVRDMLAYHTENAQDPATKISQGRALMQFLAQSHGTDDEYGALMRSEAQRVLKYDSNHFYHDDLAEINEPFFLHQFADLAGAHGLQYLGDADYSSMHALRYPPEVRDVLAGLGDDVIRAEQYLDFLKCRRFRQSLLCHQEVKVLRQVPPEVLEGLYFASAAKPDSDAVNLLDGSSVTFKGEGSLQLTTSHPLAKVTLAYLGLHWPDRVSLHDLAQAAGGALGSLPEQGSLEHVMTEFLQMGAAEAHAMPAPFATRPTERPRASAWALYQRQFGGGITNLRHQTLHIRDDFGLWLLGQMDGTRTADQIAHEMAATVKPGPDGNLDMNKELQEARELVQKGLAQLAVLGFQLAER